MLAALVISANLALLITAGLVVQPPTETNPDCNVSSSESHIYQSCSFVCGGDEAIYFSENETCALSGNMTGICVNATCIPLPASKPEITGGEVEPPVETNPDCNVSSSENYVYQECTFVCGGDEVMYLNENETCTLGAGGKGICVNGQCVALPENRPEIEITDVSTPLPKPPRCSDNTTNDHVHPNCTLRCGDELVALSNNEPCTHKDGKGTCVDGTCTRPFSDATTNTPEIEVNEETTAAPMPPGCSDNATNDHIHPNCTLKCGDELVPLNRNETCILWESSTPVPVALERSEMPAARGVCKEGSCVPKHTDYSVPVAIP